MLANHGKNVKSTSAHAEAVASHPQSRQVFFTVPQFAEIQKAFTQSALRNLIFKAEARRASKGTIPGNGLIECGAVVRIGRKILIHEGRFLEWVQKPVARRA